MHAHHDHHGDRSAHGAGGHGHRHGAGAVAAGHAHASVPHGRAFALGVLLNLLFVAVEAGFGLASHSMALLADAGHNLSDVLGLLIAWGAAWLQGRRPGGRYTYGFGSASILAALANAVLLLVAIGVIAVEAVGRFADPAPVAGRTVMAVAAVGILVNGVTALLFARGGKGDLNIRGAFLHMAADAAVSLGVVTAGLLIVVTGKTWIDPVTSLLVVAVVGAGTWGLLRDAVHLSLAAVPPGMEPDEIRAFLAGQPLVGGVHDLHIWPMSTTETALTAHLLIPAGHPGDAFLASTQAMLHDRFGIAHATIQIEVSDLDHGCRI